MISISHLLIDQSPSKHFLSVKVKDLKPLRASTNIISSSCPKNTYDQDLLQRKNSGLSIGKGNRSDFTKVLTSSPGVSKYNLKSFFDGKDSRMKGYSLRMSR